MLKQGLSAILTATCKKKRKRGKNIVSHTSPHPHGEILPRLQDLIDEASTLWGISVTLQMVSRATGLNIKIIRAYYTQETDAYALKTVGKLGWFFQCPTESVISWYPPGGQAPESVRVGTIQLPRTITIQEQTISNLIPEQLAGIPLKEIQEGTGLTHNTISGLRKPRLPLERIRGKTLAAICDFLSQREKRLVSLSELLPRAKLGAAEEERGRRKG